MPANVNVPIVPGAWRLGGPRAIGLILIVTVTLI
jgi:hypothetical protein